MKALRVINLSVGLVVIVLLLVAGIYLQRLLKPVQGEAIVWQTDATCDLGRTACVASHAGKSLQLQLSQPVGYLQRTALNVKTTGFAPQAISEMRVDFSMSGMEMGINRFALSRDENGPGWKGMAILPVCVSGRSDWQARLHVMAEGKRYVAIFKLTVAGTP